jgi:hypothetical protein
MSIEEDAKRWERAAHAMQSGVAMEMQIPIRQKSTEPKHLRVGVNTAISDHGALIKLLIAKGFFTEVEYMKAIADQMEVEKTMYEERLTAHFGKPIKLG